MCRATNGFSSVSELSCSAAVFMNEALLSATEGLWISARDVATAAMITIETLYEVYNNDTKVRKKESAIRHPERSMLKQRREMDSRTRVKGDSSRMQGRVGLNCTGRLIINGLALAEELALSDR